MRRELVDDRPSAGIRAEDPRRSSYLITPLLLQRTDGGDVCPRQAIAAKGSRELARDVLQMSQEEFSAAFRGSPMKRAKRRGLARNAAGVLGNVGAAEDIPVLEAALAHRESLVREHAAWAITRIAERRGG